MTEESRRYKSESGRVYTQKKVLDEKERVISEYWSREGATSGPKGGLKIAVYVSEELCSELVTSYRKNEMFIDDLIKKAKQEDYRLIKGRILFVDMVGKLWQSTIIGEINPPFEDLGDTGLEKEANLKGSSGSGKGIDFLNDVDFNKD